MQHNGNPHPTSFGNKKVADSLIKIQKGASGTEPGSPYTLYYSLYS